MKEAKRRKIWEHFAAGTTTQTAAKLLGVNKTTAAYYYHRLREIICQAIADDIEVVSCFGERRQGKRGRSAAGKMAY